MTFARAWTGFNRQATRGNIEAVWGYSTANWIDPMTLDEDWRDVFPKMDLRDDFIGDRYPLCVARPSRAFLRAGATWRYLGQASPRTPTRAVLRCPPCDGASDTAGSADSAPRAEGSAGSLRAMAHVCVTHDA